MQPVHGNKQACYCCQQLIPLMVYQPYPYSSHGITLLQQQLALYSVVATVAAMTRCANDRITNSNDPLTK
jgi:hypothetical protein